MPLQGPIMTKAGTELVLEPLHLYSDENATYNVTK